MTNTYDLIEDVETSDAYRIEDADRNVVGHVFGSHWASEGHVYRARPANGPFLQGAFSTPHEAADAVVAVR